MVPFNSIGNVLVHTKTTKIFATVHISPAQNTPECICAPPLAWYKGAVCSAEERERYMERGEGNAKEGTGRKRKERDVRRKVRYRKEREGGKGRRGMSWNLPPPCKNSCRHPCLCPPSISSELG